MSISVVRFFAATVVVLLLIVLTQDLAPRAEGGNLTASFAPNPLQLLNGASGNLTVTVTAIVTQDDVDAGSI